MPMGMQHKGMVRRDKMLHAAIELFLENGYDGTTTASIAKRAGMAPSSFFAAFESKEALLLTLTELMFTDQFDGAERIVESAADPLLLYCAEVAIQMHIVEMSESMRNIYVAAYSLPSTSEYIYANMAKRLKAIFSAYMPNVSDRDFYELELASAGITRAYMAKRCDGEFTMGKKLCRYMDCCMTLYRVPKEKREEIISVVLELDLASQAKSILHNAIERAAGMADRQELN